MHRWCNVASSAVDHMFNLRLGQTKGCKLAICCYSADHAAVMSKSKDGWSRNQHNESEWGRFIYARTVVSVGMYSKDPLMCLGLVHGRT